MRINTISDLRAAVRNGPYAWPGGYQMRFICSDGESMCFDCVAHGSRREVLEALNERIRDGKAWNADWDVMAFEVHWEGSAEICANCNRKIPNSYGDPDSETEE